MNFDQARAVADAVLLEGYVLYPYRSTSTKNRYRWIFGVLAPRVWSEHDGCEPWCFESQCLVDTTADTTLSFVVRFLQVCRRRVEQSDDGGATFVPVPSMELDGTLHVSWDEGDRREVTFQRVPLTSLSGGNSELPFEQPGERSIEMLRDAQGIVRGRIVRESATIRGRVLVRVEPAPGANSLRRLHLRLENIGEEVPIDATRDEAIPSSCVAAHALIGVEGGSFVSVFDPPDASREAAKSCRQTRAWPVLVGDRKRQDLMLVSPIILYDFPQIAPESPGDFFDAGEIDELLTLRTANLTDAEKREARATDARAAEIVDRVDALPREVVERLHGTFRDLERAEMVPRSPSKRFAPGTRVRLKAPKRRTDAQDLLYVGRIAVVEKVMHDVDHQVFLAVTLEDDPGAELNRSFGRFHYYAPDEVEFVEEPAAAEVSP
jgi:hypothetical protein